MAVNAPNPKPLNPSASPYTRAEASVSSPFLPPNSGMIVLPSKLPQLSQEIYGSHPQQSQSQLAWVTRSVPTMVPGFLANPYLSVQHKLTQAWVYQEATAYYNIYRQPFTVPYPHLHYSDSGNQGTCCTPGENSKESEAVQFEERVKCEDCYSGVLGNVEKRVFGGGARRFVAPPRLRAKRRDSEVFLGEKLWVPKTESKLYGESSGDDQGLSAKEEDGVLSCSTDEGFLTGKTTLMIKNIPNQLGRHDLLRILDVHCLGENQKATQRCDRVKSEYDFFYLPMDFVRRANLGYAFVNFTNAAGALRFWKAFNRYKWDVGANRKTCEVSLATIQGKDALCNRYKNSVFPCHTNAYLPVVLLPARDGWRQTAPSIVGRRVDPAFPLERGCFSRKKSLNK